MMNILFKSVLAVSCLLVLPSLSFAKNPANLAPCNRAANTSDVMACVNKRHEEAQKALEEIYTALKDQDTGSNLNEVQQGWVAYRDLECGWEEAQAENESLKQIERLSCLTKLTLERTVLLSAFLKTEEPEKEVEETAEIETASGAPLVSFPLWMNALAEDYPDIFWQYGGRASSDLNCNEQIEHVMSGVQFDAEGHKQTVLGVVETAATGRPKAQIFDVSFVPSSGNVEKCRPDFEILAADSKPESDEECSQTIKLKHALCVTQTLSWDGEDFILGDAGSSLAQK